MLSTDPASCSNNGAPNLVCRMLITGHIRPAAPVASKPWRMLPFRVVSHRSPAPMKTRVWIWLPTILTAEVPCASKRRRLHTAPHRRLDPALKVRIASYRRQDPGSRTVTNIVRRSLSTRPSTSRRPPRQAGRCRYRLLPRHTYLRPALPLVHLP